MLYFRLSRGLLRQYGVETQLFKCIFRQKLLFQKAKRSDSFFYPLCGKHFSTTHFQQGVLNSYEQ